ncbi:MAG: hypothetical protein NTV15_00450, partial [Candidatus Bathyarchaeota archaeon]|nr:hypothetical protein [Candidatus Bathyarchaeota archaeon]
PIINIPIIALNVYSAYEKLQQGVSWKSFDFAADAFLILVIFAITTLLPNWVPVYQSSYMLDEGGIKLTRFLRRPLTVSYKKIVRVEVYIREKGEISKDAELYTKNTAAELRKAGFRFVDYTNDEANIVLLITGKDVVMISPAKPKSFLKSLKQRTPKLKAKIVELSARGKTVQELE